MASYAYHHVDVFTTRPLEGNPLAVFPDARGLDDAVMQRIALELNLSETVFVFPPHSATNAANLRIFTPRRELAFAGHPTIGAAHVLVALGIAKGDRFIVEEPVGEVALRVERGSVGATILWLTTPPVEFGPLADPQACCRALGLPLSDLLCDAAPPQYLTAGSPFLYIPLVSPEAVDRVRYDDGALPPPEWTDVTGTFVFAPAAGSVEGFPAVYARMFAPRSGIPEDPATGGATGPLAAYIERRKLLATRRFVSEQGTKMGRRSILHVNIETAGRGETSIEVGGSVVPVAQGTFDVPTSSA